MFESLKKKFSSWMGKPEEKEEKKKKPKKEAKNVVKTKSKNAASSKQKLQAPKSNKELTIESKAKKEKKIIIKKKEAKTKKPLAKNEIPELEEVEEGFEAEVKEESEVEPELEKELEKREEKEQEKEKKEEQEKEKEGGFFSKLFKGKKKTEKAEPIETEHPASEKQKQPSEEDRTLTKEEIEKEKPSFFSKLIGKLSTSTLTKEDFDEFFHEFEFALLENNVALEVVDKIKQSLEKDLVNIEVKKGTAEKIVLQSLKDSILSVLSEPDNLLEKIKQKASGNPFVILFFGINGSGKTTSIAKFAHYLKENKISCVMAAADTFRAASIEQLQTHGLNLGVEVIAHNYGSDPASVAFDAIKHAKSHNIQVVLIDTAGRMYTKANLLKEMEKIVKVSKPDLKIFVGESITGNDATEQAKTFNETAGIDGIILSKADVDEKAGAILSVSYVTGKPIYFLGTGQEYSDLTAFKKTDVLKHLGLE